MPDAHSVPTAQNYFDIAFEMQKAGELDKAFYYYGRSLDCVQSPEAYTFMAWVESQRGNLTAAVELCCTAIRFDRDFGNAWNDLGAYLIDLDRAGEAIPYLEQALRCPRYLTYHYAHYNLGRAYEELGDLAMARRKYEDALAEEPTYVLAGKALQRLNEQEPRQP